jgi:hypothetical protein
MRNRDELRQKRPDRLKKSVLCEGGMPKWNVDGFVVYNCLFCISDQLGQQDHLWADLRKAVGEKLLLWRLLEARQIPIVRQYVLPATLERTTYYVVQNIGARWHVYLHHESVKTVVQLSSWRTSFLGLPSALQFAEQYYYLCMDNPYYRAYNYESSSQRSQRISPKRVLGLLLQEARQGGL